MVRGGHLVSIMDTEGHLWTDFDTKIDTKLVESSAAALGSSRRTCGDLGRTRYKGDLHPLADVQGSDEQLPGIRRAEDDGMLGDQLDGKIG